MKILKGYIGIYKLSTKLRVLRVLCAFVRVLLK